MKRLFGTDGMRGEAGRFPLDRATLRTVGVSLTAHLREKLAGRSPVIVTGRDTRESGYWLEEALIAGAIAAGASCKSAGVITTPGVAFLARSLPADAGVVISASHNPFQDNGVKIFSPSGKKLDEATERMIEADIRRANAGAPDEGSIEISDYKGETVQLTSRYLDFLVNEIGHDLSLSDLSLVVDCANGAASPLAPELFRRLGARVTPLNDQPDGRNINRDCGSLHTAAMQQRVVAEQADFGVAFDGDADRALFSDRAGRFVDGDGAMWVLANYLHARGKLSGDVVVGTVMSNVGLEIALRSRGLRLVRTDVGDKYVLDELLQSGASLGGEQSGHLIFPHLSLAGDGMITALSLLRAMSEQGHSLAELLAGFEQYPQVLVNVRVHEKKPFADIESLQTLVRDTEAKLANRGRLLLRYSGTEPLARVMIEGEDQAEIETLANNLAAAISAAIGSTDLK
jgi:phosphoglucosamine mutase